MNLARNLGSQERNGLKPQKSVSSTATGVAWHSRAKARNLVRGPSGREAMPVGGADREGRWSGFAGRRVPRRLPPSFCIAHSEETADAGHDVLRPGRRPGPVEGEDDRHHRLWEPGARGAQNLRDSGCHVVVGQRPGSANYELAVKHGFKPVSAAEAAEAADLVNLLLPDEVQADIFAREIKPKLRPGNLLLCSHGFNIHFGQVVPPEGVDSALVAPKGPGHLVRSEFVKGGGVPCLIATAENCTPAGKRRRWPTPRGSAAPAAASSRRPSPRRPRPTSSASRSSSAAVSARWSRWASRP